MKKTSQKQLSRTIFLQGSISNQALVRLLSIFSVEFQ